MVKQTGSLTGPLLIRRLLPLVAAALLACEGGGGGPIVDSNTNWMTECSANSDCDETACLCGVCTLPCQSPAACVDLAESAACIAPGDTRFDSLCHPSSQPICVPACVGDVDCPGGAACHDGVCTPVWTETDTEPTADADATGDSDRSDSGDAPDAVDADTAEPPDVTPDTEPDTGADATPDAGDDAAGSDPCPGGGELICGKRIGGTDGAIYRCEEGDYVDEVPCAFDCVYVAGADDVCVDDCPAELREPFCGREGLPDDYLFTCNGERVLSFGRCENGCGALTGPGPSEGCL